MIDRHEFKKISISEIKPYDRNARTHSTDMYRYIYFLTKNAKKNFQGEFIPYSKIKEIGAEMVRGEWVDSQKN